MPRGVFLLGVGLALVAGAFVFTHEVLGRSPGVTEANAGRIRKGMSMKEVEAILGGPAHRRQIDRGIVVKDGQWFMGWSGYWEGERGVAVIMFAPGKDEVVLMVFQGNPGPRPLDRLRARLRW